MIEARKIEGTHLIKCPSCNQPLLELTSDTLKVAAGGCWIDDGDTIQSVTKHLTDEQANPNAFWPMLDVGNGCTHCGESYFTPRLAMLPCNLDTEFLVQDYLLENISLPEGAITFWLCTSSQAETPHDWLMTVTKTPFGVMHDHYLGIYHLQDLSEVSGKYGVSSCGLKESDSWTFASELIVRMWDDLRALNVHANREIRLA